MLKLTRHLFAWSPSAETMDFYERGLFNHILASQDPATGMMCYYVPLRPGAFKTFSTENDSFWCCVGTGMENHAKYPDTIYFHDDQSLYVNLFIPSELTWKAKGLVVRQETRFPEEDTTRLAIKVGAPVRLALKIRHPAWAQSGMTLTINGKNEPLQTQAGSYVSVEREWKDGDSIQVRLPMSLRLEAMPDDPKMIAFLYGPIVLAGDLGNQGLDSAKRYGPTAPQVGLIKPVDVPAFVGELKNVLPSTKPVPGKPLTFQTNGIGKPQDVTLVPFYKTFEPRYSVYWKVYSQAEWENRKTELAATESRRQQIERATVDAVQAGEERSEHDHGFQGQDSTTGFFEGRRSRAAQEGWFSYTLKVVPDKPVTLVCTYRGSEGRKRVFDILVDGQRVATQSLEIHPTELFDVEYPLAEALTRGKERVTIKFQAHPEAIAGSVLDVRTVQLGPEKR
jgi:hypothetical protein